MMKWTLMLAVALTLVACGGTRERSEIPAVAPVAPVAGGEVVAPSPSSSAAASSTRPVIYDYPGATRVLGETASAPSPSASPSAPAPAATSLAGKFYTVRPGDTLWRVATSHGVTVSDLKRANQLANDLIKPGQVLRIP
ncbi:MAG: LysM peptidoglycan-binding domain-containing protein [Verrucomicrobiales bacterium]|jgi:LysM repeat protein|nr:LysM peptidoglycan-binding domain-containing protein [Verrucomicrobiales bacterium]